MRRWVRRVAMGSSVLFVLTVLYWGLALRVANVDMRNMSGDAQPHYLAGGFGRTGVAWVLDYYVLPVFVVRGDGAAALVERGGPFALLLSSDSPVKWEEEGNGYKTREAWPVPGVVQVIRFDGVNEKTGGAVVLRMVSAPMWELASIFAVVPVAWEAWHWKRRWRVVEYWKARRRRRARRRLRLCRCGYDLRETRGRCPECGRAVRWVPVAVGRGKD